MMVSAAGGRSRVQIDEGTQRDLRLGLQTQQGIHPAGVRLAGDPLQLGGEGASGVVGAGTQALTPLQGGTQLVAAAAGDLGTQIEPVDGVEGEDGLVGLELIPAAASTVPMRAAKGARISPRAASRSASASLASREARRAGCSAMDCSRRVTASRARANCSLAWSTSEALPRFWAFHLVGPCQGRLRQPQQGPLLLQGLLVVDQPQTLLLQLGTGLGQARLQIQGIQAGQQGTLPHPVAVAHPHLEQSTRDGGGGAHPIGGLHAAEQGQLGAMPTRRDDGGLHPPYPFLRRHGLGSGLCRLKRQEPPDAKTQDQQG
jgi:hypothetical protein